jgi:hypothetical protein
MWKFELDEATGPTRLYYHKDRDNNAVTGWNSGWSTDAAAYGTADLVFTDFWVRDGMWWLASQADYFEDNDYDHNSTQNKNPFYVPGGSGVCANQYVTDPESRDGYGFNGYDYDTKAEMRKHFIPGYRKTLIGMLSLSPAVDTGVDPEDSGYLTSADKGDIDGFITMNTSLMKSGIEMLYKLGGKDFADKPGYNTHRNDTNYWGARRKIFYGLEQIMSSIKSTEGDQLFAQNGAPGFTELAREKEWCDIIDLPKSLVDSTGAQLRSSDIKLSDLLDEFIDNPVDPNVNGLAALPENRGDWSNYYELFDNAKELMTDNGFTQGAYNMSDNLTGIVDEIDEKVSGLERRHFQALVHTMGIILSTYDGSDWGYPDQGTMTKIVQKLPELIEAFEQHPLGAPPENKVDGYYALMKVMLGDLKYDGSLGEDEADWEANYKWDEGLLKDGGLVEYMMQNMSSSDPASVSFLDLEDMMLQMSYPDPFWSEVAGLMEEVLTKYNWKDTPNPDTETGTGDGTTL